MSWDKQIVSKELLLYMREQLITALQTKDKTDPRFNQIGTTATVLTDAIWSKQNYSKIATILEDMSYISAHASMEVWFKCDPAYIAAEKIEAIYAKDRDENDFQES